VSWILFISCFWRVKIKTIIMWATTKFQNLKQPRKIHRSRGHYLVTEAIFPHFSQKISGNRFKVKIRLQIMTSRFTCGLQSYFFSLIKYLRNLNCHKICLALSRLETINLKKVWLWTTTTTTTALLLLRH